MANYVHCLGYMVGNARWDFGADGHFDMDDMSVGLE